MTSTRWLSAEEQTAWRAFLDGSALLMERLDADLRAIGLSMAEYEILVRLSEARDGELRMTDLAAQARQSRSRLTHTVARMESAGLVDRVSCPSDRRGVLARLTEHGRSTLVEAAPVHVAGVRESFVDLLEPEEFAAIGRAFATVAARDDHGHDAPEDRDAAGRPAT